MTSEETVIGCLLKGDVKISSIPFLKAEHFADSLLGEVFSIFVRSAERGETENIQTISEKVADIPGIPLADIMTRLAALYRDLLTDTVFVRCAESVFRDFRKRTATAILSNASFSFENLDSELEALIAELTSLRTQDVGDMGMSVAEMALLYRDAYPKELSEVGIQTGIKGLDKLLGGTNGGDLCFIGARPSAGKSAFANQLSRQFAKEKKKVGFFNLEMQRDSVYERLLSNQAKVSLSRIRGAMKPDVDEEERLDRANLALQKVTNIIFYTGTFTAEKIRMIVERDKLEVVIIDYMQLVKSTSRYSNRASEVGEISHAIKAIAMDFNIPIFPLVQLNRAVEMRDDKEPTLSDIRESGDIEQDASQVIFLWTVPNKEDKDDTSLKGCRVAKNRNGQLGTVMLHFKGDEMRFEEVLLDGEPKVKSVKESKEYAFNETFGDDQYDLPFA